MARPLLDLALLASFALLLVWKVNAPSGRAAPPCIPCMTTPAPAAAETPELIAGTQPAKEPVLKPCCQAPTRAALQPVSAPAGR